MSAVRALRQVVSSSCRGFAARPFSCRALPILAARISAAAPASSRMFSVSARRFGQGTTDVAVSQRLQHELNYEEANPQKPVPEFLKVFQDQGVWEIEDVPGNDEITLRRTFGNENLRLMFSIAEMPTEEEDFTSDEEGSGAREGEEEESFHSLPIRTSLSITKTTHSGCLNVDMICQEGQLVVENISYYKDGKLGTDLTAEADWKRRGLYIGPQFDSLDPAVQEEFEKYLQERGVDEHVALFIPEYAGYKEQNEYVKWLENLKSFVDQ